MQGNGDNARNFIAIGKRGPGFYRNMQLYTESLKFLASWSNVSSQLGFSTYQLIIKKY